MNKNLENGIIKTYPKKWNKEDENILLELKNKGISNKDIGEYFGRSEISISIKYKRLHKKDDTYNLKHIIDKNLTNDDFIKLINPKSLLDVYAGKKYYTKFNIYNYITNDKNGTETDYKLEAFEFLSKFYNKTFDIVDLDPFGSAFDCFDLSIKIADKGLIITLGELGHRRFKRLDFVKNRYNINNIKDDWIEKINNYIINRGLIFKKILTPIFIKDWNNIGRIYYKIEKYKELSQWK